MSFCCFYREAAQLLFLSAKQEGQQGNIKEETKRLPPFLIIGPGHAKTCLMPYANNKGADQLEHARSLISTFVVRCLDSMMCILAITKVSRLYLAEWAGLSLTWSKIPEDTFSRDVGQLIHSIIFF